MATETAAVLEWNFENVLIYGLTGLRGSGLVSELCQES